jgi:hypothetical protein
VQGYPSFRGKPIARHLLPDIDPKRHSTAVGSSDLLRSDAESEGIEASEGIGCPKVWQEAPQCPRDRTRFTWVFKGALILRHRFALSRIR